MNKIKLLAEVVESHTAGGVSLGGWIGIVIGVSILTLIIGAILGMLFSKKLFEKQLKENPPITEKQVRAMFAQMGRKASETQIRNIMRSMKVNK